MVTVLQACFVALHWSKSVETLHDLTELLMVIEHFRIMIVHVTATEHSKSQFNTWVSSLLCVQFFLLSACIFYLFFKCIYGKQGVMKSLLKVTYLSLLSASVTASSVETHSLPSTHPRGRSSLVLCWTEKPKIITLWSWLPVMLGLQSLFPALLVSLWPSLMWMTTHPGSNITHMSHTSHLLLLQVIQCWGHSCVWLIRHFLGTEI